MPVAVQADTAVAVLAYRLPGLRPPGVRAGACSKNDRESEKLSSKCSGQDVTDVRPAAQSRHDYKQKLNSPRRIDKMIQKTRSVPVNITRRRTIHNAAVLCPEADASGHNMACLYSYISVEIDRSRMVDAAVKA